MYCNIKTLIRAEGNVAVIIQMGKSNTLKKTMMGVYLLLSDIGEPGTKNKMGGGCWWQQGQ
jgi:hypothetical protein